MGFEPTTPTLATFGFMRQSSDFCVVSMHDGTERHKNIRRLRGRSADKLRTLADGFGGLT